MADQPVNKFFVRFLLVGVLNTAFGYGIFALAVAGGVPPEAALLVATVLGVMFNFMTTGRLVFRDSSPSRLLRFCAAYGTVYVVNATALRALVGAGLSPFLAQAALLPCAVVITFLLMKTYVFREKPA